MRKIDPILNRLRYHYGIKKDIELCKKIGINYGAFDSWKSRDKIPLKRLEEISEKENLSLDWIIKGEGIGSLQAYDKSTDESKSLHVKENLESHISDKELEILEAYRGLPKERQELFYHKLKAEAIEYKSDELKAM